MIVRMDQWRRFLRRALSTVLTSVVLTVFGIGCSTSETLGQDTLWAVDSGDPTNNWLSGLGTEPLTSERVLAWIKFNAAVLPVVNYAPVAVIGDLTDVRVDDDGVVITTYRTIECLKGAVPEGVLKLPFIPPIDDEGAEYSRTPDGGLSRDMFRVGDRYIVYAHFRELGGHTQLVIAGLPLPDTKPVRRNAYNMLRWVDPPDGPY